MLKSKMHQVEYPVYYILVFNTYNDKQNKKQNVKSKTKNNNVFVITYRLYVHYKSMAFLLLFFVFVFMHKFIVRNMGGNKKTSHQIGVPTTWLL